MAKPASRPAKRGGSSIFTGVLIGLSVGVIVTVGVALWVTGNNPFKADSAPPPAPPSKAAPSTPDTAPSFDFYKVLPGDAAGNLPAPPPDMPPAGPQYYLQAGAFHNPADADNLKAQLALLGLEAVIQSGNVGDKGVLHRVRVGPFRAMDEVNRTRSLMAQNNIAATLVRDEPHKQETP